MIDIEIEDVGDGILVGRVVATDELTKRRVVLAEAGHHVAAVSFDERASQLVAHVCGLVRDRINELDTPVAREPLDEASEDP